MIDLERDQEEGWIQAKQSKSNTRQAYKKAEKTPGPSKVDVSPSNPSSNHGTSSALAIDAPDPRNEKTPVQEDGIPPSPIPENAILSNKGKIQEENNLPNSQNHSSDEEASEEEEGEIGQVQPFRSKKLSKEENMTRSKWKKPPTKTSY